MIRLFEELKKEQYLVKLNKKDIAKRLAYYTAELNVLHPFRDGNGRCIREFIRQLALKNNYYLNFNLVPSEILLNASKKSVVDTSDLEKGLYNCLVEVNEVISKHRM